ncbi:amidase domain-containing protein [Streptomyces sp. MST-110588]|uniref:amidase domain-containing protein n=1 Tax=Streptomyces sp. MST-110588 TaxID=2833628 RepID=UPI001F5CB9A0|nr:amidase domain-containing protein [Streptomyces sp. MST-110588]UNO38595.1 amidase domain-containing protein [Streptomyces sp. MST-110588]
MTRGNYVNRTTLRCAIGAALSVAVAAVVLPSATATTTPEPAAPRVDKATVDAFGRAADAVLTKRTAAMVDSRTAARHIAPLPGQVRLSQGLEHTEHAGVSSLHSRKKRLAALGEAYTAGDTRVTVDSTQVKGRRATAQITETTTLTYKKIRGDEPGTTGFKARHEVTFTATPGGKWELTGIRSKDSGPGAINAPALRTAPVAAAPSTPDAPRAATSWPARQVPKRQTTAGYNYAAMAAYAEKYWRNYNPAYRKFNADGGDCTNFLSQSLKAGGWKPETGSASDYHKWWYSASGQSDSWLGVNEWSWYALNSKRVTSLSNVYQMEVGDVLQMDFDRDGSKDHSMMTTYRSRYGVPYLTYHSTNTYRKSVASIIASYPNAIYYAYRT